MLRLKLETPTVSNADLSIGLDNVAIESLPLQAILQFEPPERDQAIEYLSSLCTSLGIECENPLAYVTDLYERSIVTSSDMLEKPGPPNGNEWLPIFDLRKAVMQLQLERGHCPTESPRQTGLPEVDLNSLAKELNMRSYADAHLDQRSWAMMEVSGQDYACGRRRPADETDERTRPI